MFLQRRAGGLPFVVPPAWSLPTDASVMGVSPDPARPPSGQPGRLGSGRHQFRVNPCGPPSLPLPSLAFLSFLPFPFPPRPSPALTPPSLPFVIGNRAACGLPAPVPPRLPF